MPLSPEQHKECERVFDAIYTFKSKNRYISDMFKDLPDKAAWAEYYRVIPEPRSLHGIKDKLHKGKFKSPQDVHSDLELVFANAIHFNEEHSTISNDARTLQGVLNKEWEASVSAGILPKIEPDTETPNNAPGTSRQLPRASRSRDVASPAAPTIRIPKKATTAPTPSVSRPATLTPVPQHTVPTPQHQPAPQRIQTPQQQLISQPMPTTVAIVHPTQPNVAPITPASAPAPVLVAAPVVVPVAAVTQAPAPADAEEDTALGLVRDKQGDELVAQLEATFPRCPGPGLEGWMELPEGVDAWEKYSSIIQALKDFKDTGGDSAFDVLERVQEETTNKTLSFDGPMSISIIENNIKSKAYGSPAEFDKDLSRLFEKARKWHEEGTYPYGRVLVLQCLWQTLTSPKPEEMQIDVTSASTPTSEPIDSVTFKGLTYHIGDWVHLANKDVPPKPIIAQIQKIERSDLTTLSLTWYSRPEQTVHSATRSFWEREVFKTNFTSRNPLQEVIEPVACQFFPKHIRGRPSPPMWYPGRPLYVCETRYESSSKTFSRIKNWTSCIPDGLRKSGGDGLGATGSGWEYMPITKFDNNKTVVPRKFPSPFLKGVAGLKKRGGHGVSTAPGPQKDRSVIAAAGGPTVIPTSVIETLPEDTVKHFDRDPYTNQLLWFSGAPIETPRIRQPKHSLDYLYFLARQQEKRHRGEDLDESKPKAALASAMSVELANLHHEIFGAGLAQDLPVASADRNGDVEMSS